MTGLPRPVLASGLTAASFCFRQVEFLNILKCIHDGRRVFDIWQILIRYVLGCPLLASDVSQAGEYTLLATGQFHGLSFMPDTLRLHVTQTLVQFLNQFTLGFEEIRRFTGIILQIVKFGLRGLNIFPLFRYQTPERRPAFFNVDIVRCAIVFLRRNRISQESWSQTPATESAGWHRPQAIKGGGADINDGNWSGNA